MRVAQQDVAQSSGKVLEVTIGLGRSGTALDCAEVDPFSRVSNNSAINNRVIVKC